MSIAMKSLESRIEKLENILEFVHQNEEVIILIEVIYSKCAETYNDQCPYIENDKNYKHCPLYEQKYLEAKQISKPGTIVFFLPCFQEGECPLCLDSPNTPTGKGDIRNKNQERKDD
jgi:hypothetical protein